MSVCQSVGRSFRVSVQPLVCRPMGLSVRPSIPLSRRYLICLSVFGNGTCACLLCPRACVRRISIGGYDRWSVGPPVRRSIMTFVAFERLRVISSVRFWREFSVRPLIVNFHGGYGALWPSVRWSVGRSVGGSVGPLVGPGSGCLSRVSCLCGQTIFYFLYERVLYILFIITNGTMTE